MLVRFEFDLLVSSLMGGVYGTYPEYHTSLDDKSLIQFASLQGSIGAYEATCLVLDWNVTFQNILPYGEPQLGQRSLYPTLGSIDLRRDVEAMLWLLNLFGRYE